MRVCLFVHMYMHMCVLTCHMYVCICMSVCPQARCSQRIERVTQFAGAAAQAVLEHSVVSAHHLEGTQTGSETYIHKLCFLSL